MMLHIPEVLTRDEVAQVRASLEAAPWRDGRATAGAQAGQIKQNRQIPADAPQAIVASQLIAAALKRHPLYASAALPHILLPPRFNAYEGGGHYGNHVDSALHVDPSSGRHVRTDVSTTVFLNDPEDYDGGELIVEDSYGSHDVKLTAGDAIVYPSTSLHRVEPVTRGVRLASFTWCQSLVADDMRRAMLFELDMTILKLRQQIGDSPEIVSLTAHYHNLLRQWAVL
jgi:PKHD-type hydroxylase